MAKPETIGQRLAWARLGIGYTQAQIAKSVLIRSKTGAKKGVARLLTRTAYAMYELDASEPSVETIQKLAAVLRVNPAWLAFGTRYKKVLFIQPVRQPLVPEASPLGIGLAT